jgi:hypothetical protein
VSTIEFLKNLFDGGHVRSERGGFVQDLLRLRGGGGLKLDGAIVRWHGGVKECDDDG